MPLLDLTPIQNIVHYSFMLSFVGMTAAAIFFLAQRSFVIREYQVAITLSGIILLIAAMNYYYMKELYLSGIANGVMAFPTEFRYIDWLLTVPLMLIKFPVLLGLGPKGRHFLVILVTLALLMIITGFVGEINPNQALVHYGAFGVGCVAWLLIVGLLFFAISDLPPQVDPVTAKAIKRMSLFVLVGWSIYPVGYLAPMFGWQPDIRELIYNVGDLINKVGLAMFVYAAATGKAEWLEKQLEEQVEEVEYATNA